MTKPKRTPEEERLLKEMERLEGGPLTEHEQNLALDQARMIGDIQD